MAQEEATREATRQLLLSALQRVDALTARAEAALAAARSAELRRAAVAGGAVGKKAVQVPATNEPAVAHGHTRPARRLISPLRRPVGARFFADYAGDAAPLSAASRRRQELYSGVPADDGRRWLSRENTALRNAVTDGLRDLLKQRAEAEYLDAGGPNGSHAAARRATRDAKVAAADGYSPQELLVEVDPADLSWDGVAARVKGRSAGACRVQWSALQRPRAPARWTRAEERRLLELAQAHGGYGWHDVARELGNGRTALECFRRYQRALNPSMLRVAWTAGEDAALLKAVRLLGTHHWWQQVAEALPGRTPRQCQLRWAQTVRPGIVSGHFSAAEDARLALAVRACGESWAEVARLVPGRTPSMVRERWVNVIGPQVRREAWSPAEDAALLRAVAAHGSGNWAAVAADVGARTDNQCWRRWKALARSGATRGAAGGGSGGEGRKRAPLRRRVVTDAAGRAIAPTTLQQGDLVVTEVEVDDVTFAVATAAHAAGRPVPPAEVGAPSVEPPSARVAVEAGGQGAGRSDAPAAPPPPSPQQAAPYLPLAPSPGTGGGEPAALPSSEAQHAFAAQLRLGLEASDSSSGDSDSDSSSDSGSGSGGGSGGADW